MQDNPEMVIDVAVPVPLRRNFAYSVPEGLDHTRLAPGMRVLVPFGRRRLTGWVVAVNAEPPADDVVLKPVISVLDPAPVLPADVINLVKWCATYYHHSPGEVFNTAVPAILRKPEPLPIPIQKSLVCTDTDSSSKDLLQRAPKQRELFDLLKRSPDGLPQAAIPESFSSAVSAALVKRGLAMWQEAPVVAEPFDPTTLCVNDDDITLSSEQVSAINAASVPGTHLLFGITGSGKTEVYLKLIEQILRQGKQALVLVPEIGLTPQTIERFEHRFSLPLVTMHSGMTDNERYANWQMARDGSAAIIIGTRSSIFVPLKNPGVIIVDEEHDGSYKQNDGLRYSARDLAVLRGQRAGIPVVLGSATPSSESYYNASIGRYHLHKLTARPGDIQLPVQHIVSLEQHPGDAGLAPPTVAAMREHLDAGNQVLVFQNRRGYSPVLMCLACSWRAQCTHCDAQLTLHRRDHKLICHHCGSQTSEPTRCPSCNERQLIPLGLGTERIEQHLAALLPDYPVIRIDRDTTRRKSAFNELRAQIADGSPAMLVGTQLLAKGHHFPGVTLVVIVDLDAGFYSADFKATERTAQLLTQVGGRAGRADRAGTVMIQTHFPQEALFTTLMDHGYERFLSDLLAERAAFGLPPYRFMAAARAESRKPETALRFLTRSVEGINDPGVDILGPLPANMEKREGYYRAQVLFVSHSRPLLHETLSRFLARSDEQSRSGVRLGLDVDPTDNI